MITLENKKKIKARAAELTSQMSAEEKVFQTMHYAAPIDRLGIKKYCWWNEALHGVARAGVATVFPQAIGLAATFDEKLIHDCADVISTEARAKYNEFQRKGDYNIYKGLTFWSPNVNIFRDPRWGRGHETYGEDPYLSGAIGAAFVRGIQGDHPRFLKAAACAKHFVAHSGPEQTRAGFDAIVSRKDLYETYLPAFRACVRADVEAVMGAYNRFNGKPCCGSLELIDGVLRDELGFDGHFVSDCGAVANFHAAHHVTETPAESAAMAVRAGCDLECGGSYSHLLAALDDGLITEEEIGRSVERLIATRIKLGIVDGGDGEVCPYDDIPYAANDAPENRQMALEAARKAMVLLKNDGLLPLDPTRKMKIAVIGPNADSKKVLEGNYNGTASHYYTVLDGFRALERDGFEITYAEGCHLYLNKVEMCAEENDRVSEAVSAAENSDISVVCVGLDPTIEGEAGDAYNAAAGGDKIDLELPGMQNALLDAVIAVGKPVIVVNLCGSALNLVHAEKANALIQAWYPGEMGGVAIADLIFGRFSPAGRLPVTFYRSVEDLPDFEDYSMKGRTYRYFDGDVLYPFGYGLSYTRFAYSPVKLDADVIKVGESTTCRVEVENIGNVDSDEVVQLYIRDDETSCAAPICQLKGFNRVHIPAHGRCTVEFEITPEALSLVLEDGSAVVESGSFTLYVGGCSPCKNQKLATAKLIIQ